MSTPMKALIQERLRAKMIPRGLDCDEYEGDSERLLYLQLMDANTVATTTISNAGSHGLGSRRTSTAHLYSPMRLHTHIDPSAYLVPSHQDDRFEILHGTNVHNPFYCPEQYRHLQTDQRQRHHEVCRQLPLQGGSTSSDLSQTCTSLSPYHRADYSPPPSKFNLARSPNAVANRSPTSHVQSPRVHQEQGLVHSDYGNTNNVVSSSGCPAPDKSNYSTHRQASCHQQECCTWNDCDQYHSGRSAYEVKDLSPQRDYDHNNQHDKLAECSPVDPSQIESYSSRSPITTSSICKLQLEEINVSDNTKIADQIERQSPPALDMGSIELPVDRKRIWNGIMSPESRLAAKAFVEKRQRRNIKGTPRTMATQRWLEVIDARAIHFVAN